MNQNFFCPPKHTLIEDINNKQLQDILFMQADPIRKHLSDLPATAKGRMRRPQKGLCSTKAKKKKSRSKREVDKEIIDNTQQPHIILEEENMRAWKIVFAMQH